MSDHITRDFPKAQAGKPLRNGESVGRKRVAKSLDERGRNQSDAGTLVFAASRREVKSMFMLSPLMTLMADAARVIEIRLRMIALGTSTPDEMFLMVSEKMSAMAEAKSIFVRGGDPSLVIENYQKIVAANVARLSDSQNY
jgi:hypothetical protein